MFSLNSIYFSLEVALLLVSSGILTYLLLAGQTPFSGSTDFDTLQNIRNGNLVFGERLANISPDAKDFITRLLVPDQNNRLTSEQALNHPWLKYVLQHVESAPISSDRLQGIYSRQLYDVRFLFDNDIDPVSIVKCYFVLVLQREHRRSSSRPQPLISEILSMKGDYRGYGDDGDVRYEERQIRGRTRRTSRG